VTLFSVTCETCKTRLKVRDTAIVGQIHACPKCGSMVLIQAAPPEKAESDGPGAAPNRQSALPSSDFDDAAELLSEDTAVSKDPQSKSSRRAASRVGDPGDSGELNEPAGPPVTSRKEDDSPTGSASDSQAAGKLSSEIESEQEGVRSEVPKPGSTQKAKQPPPPPTEKAQLEEATQGEHPPSAQWQQMAVMTAAVVLGLIIAVGFFVFLVSRGGDKTGQSDSKEVAQVPDGGAAKTKPLTDKKNTSKKANKNVAKQTFAEPPAKKKTSPGKKSSNKKAGKNTKTKKNANKVQAAPPGLTPRKDIGDDIGLDAVLSPFSQLLTQDPIDIFGKKGKKTKQKGKTKGKRATQPIVPTTPSMVDSRAQLTRRIPELEFTKTPLIGFLRFVSDLTTIPITLDTRSLRELGISVDTLINVKRQNATVAEILTAACKPLGLSWVLDEGHLVVGRPNDQLVERNHDIPDLAKDQASSDLIRNYVISLVDRKTWAGQGGKGKITVISGKQLQIHQRPATQNKIERLLVLLRRARGLKPNGDSANPTEVVPPSLAKRLARPITANYLRQTNLVEILDYIQTKADIRILVDWRSLYQEGLTPQTESKVSAISVPIQQSLEMLFKRFPTGFRVVDKTTIEMTSKLSLQTSRLLGAYEVKDLLDKGPDEKRLMRRIQVTIGEDRFKGSSMVFDKSSNSFLVSMPIGLHTRMQELLVTYRKPKKLNR